MREPAARLSPRSEALRRLWVPTRRQAPPERNSVLAEIYAVQPVNPRNSNAAAMRARVLPVARSDLPGRRLGQMPVHRFLIPSDGVTDDATADDAGGGIIGHAVTGD